MQELAYQRRNLQEHLRWQVGSYKESITDHCTA